MQQSFTVYLSDSGGGRRQCAAGWSLKKNLLGKEMLTLCTQNKILTMRLNDLLAACAEGTIHKKGGARCFRCLVAEAGNPWIKKGTWVWAIPFTVQNQSPQADGPGYSFLELLFLYTRPTAQLTLALPDLLRMIDPEYCAPVWEGTLPSR